MNKEIETLYKKIDAQDKIINEQALEIAELREENEKLTNLWLESQNKRRNAIEYIKEHIKYECDNAFNGMQFYSHHLYDFSKAQLLEILGDKE